MHRIPTEKELNTKVALVKFKIRGSYVKMIDEKRKATTKYTTVVHVPLDHNISDIKRCVLNWFKSEDGPDDFVRMRTFETVGSPQKSDKTMLLSKTYPEQKLEFFARQRIKDKKDAAKRKSLRDSPHDPSMGVDSTEYEEDGLPTLVEGPGSL